MSSNIGREPKEYISEKVNAGEISKADGKTILDFINDRTVTENIEAHTSASYARYLASAYRIIGKPINEWDYATFIEFSTTVKADYKPNTSRKHIGVMKTFIQFLIKTKKNTALKPEQIERVKLPKPDRMTKKAGDMLSVDEVKRIISGARNSRDRAFIAIMFESGCRPIELMSLEWEDVNFDQYGCTLNTNKKTGKPRRVRIINMAGHLKAWKNDYPTEIKGNSPVFVNLDTNTHHAITRGALRKLLQKAVTNAGITKRVHPYLFRHSRVTDMLSQGISTSVIGLQFWGTIDSQMLKTYGHLSDQQTDDILLKHAGVKNDEIKISESKPVTCPKCGIENPAGLQFCGTCGTVLDAEKYQQSLKSDDKEQLLRRVDSQQKAIDDLTKMLNRLLGEKINNFTGDVKTE